MLVSLPAEVIEQTASDMGPGEGEGPVFHRGRRDLQRLSRDPGIGGVAEIAGESVGRGRYGARRG